jgi:hypothetical protein
MPQAYAPPIFRDHPNRDAADSRPYSRHAQHPRSQSQTSLFSNRDASQPPFFTPEDRGYPYASVPPRPSYAVPPPPPLSAASATRPSSHSIPMPLIPSFPQISAPPPVNTASRPPNSASQPFFPSPYTPENSNYRWQD